MAQFRTKARAVELLGKGQIADLPTAISELWKNGYDAYGDNLEAFLYLEDGENNSEPVLVISDDGKGMNREDILDKWFVLGTDSKSRNESEKKGKETLNKNPRVKMGEKGIGRLAVAYLGPQMLMLTKKADFPLEIVFFDWRILENYNLFLSEVNIPVKSLEPSVDFKKSFEELKKDFLQNFPVIDKEEKDPWKEQLNLKKTIIEDCNNLTIPDVVLEEVKKAVENSHFTKFIVFKPDEQIIDLKNFGKIDESTDLKDEDTVNHTVSALVGLFNVFKDSIVKTATKFWIINNEGRYDLLNLRSFFTSKDFETADHLIDGTFDEFGTFNGNVRIYKKIISHTFSPIKKKGKTSYGSFGIKLGYIPGVHKESLLNEEQSRSFDQKLNLYGGLYIYRDNFRVLPYGRAENDFLEFEERRGKSAGKAFFAKRRMFGYVEITRKENEKLKDKSSREGFVNNAAYRDFRSNLIAFFIDLAKKYFATNAEYDYKRDQQEELKNLAAAEEQEQQRDIQARRDFAKKLTELPKQLEQSIQEYSELINRLKEKNKETQVAYDEVKELLSKIEECKVKIVGLKLSKPVRFEPTQLQNKKYRAYTKSYQNTVADFDTSNSVISETQNKLKIQELFKEFESKGTYYKNTLSSRFLNFGDDLETVFSKIRNEFNNEKVIFISDFNEKYSEIIPNKSDSEEIFRSMTLLEKIFNEVNQRLSDKISPYLEHLERISFDVNEDDLVGYYKIQYEKMKEEWSQTFELAQLGIAVEIIDHQFNTLYAQLAESIRSLRNHLVHNNDSLNSYKNVDTAFTHLQENYKLLQPLYRTTGRVRKDITGLELKEYLDEFFEDRFKQNKIDFVITPRAASWTVYSYESIFKPVLINVINNAIYWLQPVDKKEIRMDLIDNKLTLMNSGEPIEDFMLEDVFKLFFSNRPKGRGIGLYLAKQSLNSIGFEIAATNDLAFNQLNGASFYIYEIEKSL